MNFITSILISLAAASIIVYALKFQAWRSRVKSGSASAWEIYWMEGGRLSPSNWIAVLRQSRPDHVDGPFTKFLVRFFPWVFLVKESAEGWVETIREEKADPVFSYKEIHEQSNHETHDVDAIDIVTVIKSFFLANKIHFCRFTSAGGLLIEGRDRQGKSVALHVSCSDVHSRHLYEELEDTVETTLMEIVHAEIPEDTIYTFCRIDYLDNDTELYGNHEDISEAIDSVNLFAKNVEKPTSWSFIKGSAPALILSGTSQAKGTIQFHFCGTIANIGKLQDIVKKKYA